MIMAPALGVPSEELLQDTFKSIIVSIGTLVTAFTYLWLQREAKNKITVHSIFILPALLCLYSIGSIFWAHAYLASVEAIRWFILTILLCVSVNCLNTSTTRRLIYGIHIGITIASIWTALQFWFDFAYFPQGPNPASTFINRNFFAEYNASTLPLSIYLLVTASKSRVINIIAATLAFNIITLCMSGTRSALIAMLFVVLMTSVGMLRYWNYFNISKLSKNQLYGAIGVIAFTIISLGFLPTTNKNIVKEFGVQTPITRAISRTASVAQPKEYTTGSFSVRSTMWKATGQMIAKHPISGIGAGAWEVVAPLYQNSTAPVETDFYAHNEFLQLIAEYGVVGWLFCAILGIYIFFTAKKIVNKNFWQSNIDIDQPLRFFGLISLLTLLLVSNAGFPFRLASTGALFVLLIALLISIDAEDISKKSNGLYFIKANKNVITILLCIVGCSLVLATYISALAIKCESDLVRAVKLALTVTNSGQPNDPHWDKTKIEINALLKEGIEINPHYRKLTPMAADEMASWGDWRNAIWVWDSVLQSRPNVIALSANIAKGYLQLGDRENADRYLSKALAVQPNAPTVRSIQALLYVKDGNYSQAIPIIRGLIKDGIIDYDLVYAAYQAGNKSHDYALVIDALQLRLKHWPEEATDAWMKLGDVYSLTDFRSDEKALFCYEMALKSAPNDSVRLMDRIPPIYRNQLKSTDGITLK